MANPRWVITSAIMLSGCSAGTVYVIPADMQKIESNELLVTTQQVDRAVYWMTDERVHVVISRGNMMAKSDGPRDTFGLTLELDGLPAGSARMYRVGGRALRAVRHAGALHERFASIRGVVTITREADGRLSGKFRITAQRQYFDILTGWNTTPNTLVVGEFLANLDPAGGEALAQRIDQETLLRRDAAEQPGRPRRVVGPPVED